MDSTFLDPDLQGRFQHDGFVRIQLLDGVTLERLQLIYSELAPTNGIGFHTTICGDPIGRKVVTDSILRAEVGPSIEAYLEDYRLIFANFASRFPGPESEIVIHQDWAFVDETRSLSIGVWCPLTPEHSPLSIIEKSHLHLETHRGGNDPTLPNYAEEYPRLLSTNQIQQLARPIPLAAGEALFFDHRLAYFSPANLSADTDVAMLFGAIPTQAELLHFHRSTSTRVDVFRIDPSFLVEQEFGIAPAGEPTSHQAFVSRSHYPDS